MKSLKIITLAVFMLLVGISSAEAQQNKNRGNNMNNAAVETLTAEQMQLIQEQRAEIKAKRDLFRASLTEEQLAIFDNAALTRQERHDALMLSLTETQKALILEHRQSVQESKQEFRQMMTSEQRQQIRSRMQMNRDTQGGSELRETVREQRKQRMHNNGGN
jgi:hypothetical protein